MALRLISAPEHFSYNYWNNEDGVRGQVSSITYAIEVSDTQIETTFKQYVHDRGQWSSNWAQFWNILLIIVRTMKMGHEGKLLVIDEIWFWLKSFLEKLETIFEKMNGTKEEFTFFKKSSICFYFFYCYHYFLFTHAIWVKIN